MIRTKSGLPKHCSWNLDREDGKRRVRFRWRGFSTYLTGTPWSEEFMRQYAAALDGVKAQAKRAMRFLLSLAGISRAEGQHAGGPSERDGAIP
jgi:hypothetical protein